MTQSKPRLLPLLATVLISGCAIWPSPLSDIELARAASDRALVADARRDTAYAAVQNAYANGLAAMGNDSVGAVKVSGIFVSDHATQWRTGGKTSVPVKLTKVKYGNGAA